MRTSSNQNTSEPCQDTLLDGRKSDILVNIPQITSTSLRIPNSTKKASVQDVIRSKLNRIHVGLRKRRALSVQEVFSSPTCDQPPTFYVPSPTTAREERDFGSVSLPITNKYDLKYERGRQRNRIKFDTPQSQLNVSKDNGYHSYEGEDKLPFEPEPDYDDEKWSPVHNRNANQRRWSVVDEIMRYGSNLTQRPKREPAVEIDSGPSSIPFQLNIEPSAAVPPKLQEHCRAKVKNKIPKAKLITTKRPERARSHSPVKNKGAVNSTNSSGDHSELQSQRHYGSNTNDQHCKREQNDNGYTPKIHSNVSNFGNCKNPSLSQVYVLLKDFNTFTIFL